MQRLNEHLPINVKSTYLNYNSFDTQFKSHKKNIPINRLKLYVSMWYWKFASLFCDRFVYLRCRQNELFQFELLTILIVSIRNNNSFGKSFSFVCMFGINKSSTLIYISTLLLYKHMKKYTKINSILFFTFVNYSNQQEQQ